MILHNDKALFIYGFDLEEQEQINKIIKELKIQRAKLIDESMGKMTVQDIINGLKFEIYDKDIPKERVILFNNFEDGELESCISKVRNTLEKQPILAVITPTSLNWTFKELLNHLIAEREWFEMHK